MQALHFGAGNIGRGFIGKLLADAGIKVTFADVNQPLLDAINQQQSYTVNVVGEQSVIEKVTNVSAINSTTEAAVEAIANTDLITTAVGPTVLEKIAGTFAKGLLLRKANQNNQPLNIIACENMVRGTTQFKKFILAYIPQEDLAWIESHIGFVDSAVDRIVPPTEKNSQDPLEVTVETFSEWIVDKTQFCGEIPNIAGMELTDNLMAFVERKLFTLNTGHTITAYLGQVKGLQTIEDAILEPTIRQVARASMEESGAVLIKRYGFDPVKHAQYIDKIISRFENPYLHDDVERVGRQPMRKLGLNERFIKPLLGTVEYNLPRTNLILGVIGALHFQCADDPQAVELKQLLAEKSLQAVLVQLTELPADHTLIQEIIEAYNKPLAV